MDTGESQFVIGTETGSDVLTVVGDGVKARHAWVWISEAGLQVEDLGGGTLLNGYQITERVQVEYPASVQVGDVTLVIEVKEVQPVVVSPTPSSIGITIPQRAVTKCKASLEVTIPQRTPTRSGVQKTAAIRTPSAQQSSANEAPLQGKYTLVREIARGGMGQIYFGEDPQLKRNVAVKVSSVSEAGEDPRFSKEAEVLAQLAHPNIVPIHNIGVDAQGRPFYSMKLVKGRTLQAVLNLIRDRDAAAIKEYPRATLLTIFRKVCDAMMFAHSKGILHRDLKPENIMVGEYGEVLVMDWGLAKVLGEKESTNAGGSRVNDTGDYGMTMEGEVMGTPQYMSPEQAMGMVAELDPRSDIYSLGGILYAILTLRPPIEGTTLDEVLTKVKNGSISSMVTKRGGKGAVSVGAPIAMGAEVPEALQAVTLKAMATDRNKRYGDVELLAADIEAYQSGFATQAEGAGVWRQALLFIKRNKAISAVAAVFALAVVVFTFRIHVEREQAIAAMKKSRHAAAAAELALAEAAEQASDSATLQGALSRIPEDLRTTDWGYFQSRVDTASFTIEAPKENPWRSFDNIPSDPARMLAMRSDGELFFVNVRTGALEPLWKFNPPGGQSPRMLAVSREGDLVALGYTKDKLFCIDVCHIANGESAGGFQTKETWDVSKLVVSGKVCVLRTGTARNLSTIEVWDYRSGTLLWKRGGFDAELSEDQNAILFVSGAAETRDLLTGEVLSSGAPGGSAYFHGWILHNGATSPDLGTYLSPVGIGKGLRKVNLRTGKIDMEVTPRYGNFAVAWIPPGNFFAVAGNSAPGACVLEIRDGASGDISRILPFFGSMKLNSASGQIFAKEDALAVFNSGAALKIWRLEDRKPDLELAGGGTRLGNSSLVAISSGGVVDGSEKDSKKRVLFGGTLSIQGQALAEAAGHRWVASTYGKLAGFELGEGGPRMLWAPKAVRSASHYSTAVHPSEDRVWTGGDVYKLSSGQKLTSVKNRHGLSGRQPVWVGANRVLELSSKNSADVNFEEASDGGGLLALWDAETGDLIAQTKAPRAVWVCASPDGKQVAEAGSDKKVRIRNASTLEVEKEFRAHEEKLLCVAWHPSLPLLATSAQDGTLRIWNVATLQKVEGWSVRPSYVSTIDQQVVSRIEITGDGRELNVCRSNKILVFKPLSFAADQSVR